MPLAPDSDATLPPRRRRLRRCAAAALAAVLGPLGATLPTTAAHAAPTAAQRLVYVANLRGNSVTAYDPSTRTAVATVPVGAFPEGVAVSPNGAQAYVTNNGSNTVSVIDTATDTVTSTIAVGRSPGPVAFSPDGSHAYVGRFVSPGVGGVDVIDTATGTVTTTVQVGNQPFGIALTPDGRHAYVANFVGSSVSVIDTATDTVTATISSPGARTPAGVAITPDGAHAYTANFNSGNVSVIDTATNTITGTIPVGGGPVGVTITPDGAHLYVADENADTVSVVDTATGTVTSTVPVGATPTAVLADPAGGAAYVANGGADSLSAIDTATDTVTSTTAVGSVPLSLGMATVAPTVTRVDPTRGPAAGGGTVTITGTHLSGTGTVMFGSTPATGVTVVNDFTVTATIPAHAAGTVDVTVTTPAGTSAATAADRYAYASPFAGFLPPVENPPAVNRVNAGQTIPMRFGLGGDRGPNVIAPGYPVAQQVVCTGGAPVGPAVATSTPGGSTLQYDAATGIYTYPWKTEKSYAGTCRVFTLGLNDGTTHSAYFQFG